MENKNNILDAFMPLLKSALIVYWCELTNLIVIGMAYAGLKNKYALEDFITQNQGLFSIITYLILFLGVWAFDKHKDTFLTAFKEWHLGDIFKYIIYGVGLYLFSNLLTSLLMLIPSVSNYSEEINSSFTSGEYLINFIVMVILAPIIEEYLFRNKVQGYLTKAFNVRFGIVLQAILFGMVHALAIQKIYAIVIGIFFGWANEKKGNVKPSIIMHMTVNLIGWCIGSFLIG